MQEKKDRPFEVGDLVVFNCKKVGVILSTDNWGHFPIRSTIGNTTINFNWKGYINLSEKLVETIRKPRPGSAESRAIVVALLRRARHFKQMAMESRIESSKTICAIGHATVMGDYEIAKAMLK